MQVLTTAPRPSPQVHLVLEPAPGYNGGQILGNASTIASYGVALFDNVIFDEAGTFKRLTAIANGLGNATSPIIRVLPGPMRQLAIKRQPQKVRGALPVPPVLPLEMDSGRLVITPADAAASSDATRSDLAPSAAVPEAAAVPSPVALDFLCLRRNGLGPASGASLLRACLRRRDGLGPAALALDLNRIGNRGVRALPGDMVRRGEPLL